MPEQHVALPLDLSFTAAQMERIQRGFVPDSMDDKWFLYFSDSCLFMHRSWTGFLVFQVHFVRQSEDWRAIRAVANRDRAQYGSEDDEEDRQLIAAVIDSHLVNPQPPHEDGLLVGLKLAMQPNYLGSPQVVRDVVTPVFATAVERWAYVHLPSMPKVTHEQVDQACRLAESVFSGNHPDYAVLPGWHSVEQLGQTAVACFDLDPDYCAGEDLNFIMVESTAAVSLAIRRVLDAWAADPGPTWADVIAQLHRMQAFVEAVLLGTHTLTHAGSTLRDFDLPPGERDEGGEVCDDEDIVEEEEDVTMELPQVRITYHPKPDDNGGKVRIHHPHASRLEGFDDSRHTVTICPGDEIPAGLNGIAFASWSPPTTWNDWADVEGQMEMDEPPMYLKAGKDAASGVLIVEPDGRAWVVSPSNRYGGYENTFPKGRNDDDLPFQANAIREAHEESGLKVRIIALLGDVERTTTVTRYYLARRVGGSPADMGWESQAVHLVPIVDLHEFLDSKNDRTVVDLLAQLGQQ